MRVVLEYGKQGLAVNLPEDRPIRYLAYKDAAPLVDPAGAVAQVMQHPTGCPPLAEVAAGRT